jgi:oligopeptide/dipeptide ABC transporter ATP-binding protein
MPYTRALMDSIPRLSESSGTRLRAIAGRPPDLIHPPPGCRFAPRCPYAQDKCRESEPPLRTAGTADHLFACWFPLVNGIPTAPSTRIPAPSVVERAIVPGGDPAISPSVSSSPADSVVPTSPASTAIDPGAEVQSP